MKIGCMQIITIMSVLLLTGILQAGEGTACRTLLDCNPKHECRLNKSSGRKECHKNRSHVCKNNYATCTDACKAVNLDDMGYMYGVVPTDDFGKSCDQDTACLCKEKPEVKRAK